MVKAFAEFGVTPEMIELRLQHKLKAISGPEFAQLKRIYRGIRDGMSTPEQWFGEEGIKQPEEIEKPKEEKPKAKPKKKKKAPAKKKAEEPADPTPSSAPQEPPPAEATPSGESEPLPLGGKMVDPNENTTRDRIAKVEFIKSGRSERTGEEWSLYHVVTASGEVFACFDAKIIEGAESATDNEYLCELEFRKTQHGVQLIGLEILG
jgi:hypothetical protein